MTIKYIGPADVALKDITIGEDFDERLKQDRVEAMAETITDVGLLQRVGLRQGDNVAIYGTDRIAAHVYAGFETIKAEMWECSDAEMDLLREMENAQRRHDLLERDESLLRLHKMYKEIFLVNGKNAKTAGSPSAHAIDRIAAERGVKPRSVEQALRRARRRAEAIGDPNEELGRQFTDPGETLPDMRLPEGFETHGIGVDNDYCINVSKVHRGLTEVANKMKIGQVTLTKLVADRLPVSAARLQRFRQEMHEIGQSVRQLLPKSICLFCKCIPEVSSECAACSGALVLTQEQFAGIPKKLLDMDNSVVMFRGKYRATMDFLSQQNETTPEAPTEEEEDIDIF